jgi:subfamily B ATP-binding cassette protein HlyB/CyaB
MTYEHAADSRAPGLHWLLPLLRPYGKLLSTVLLASLSIQLCSLAIPLSVQVIFDKVIPNGSLSTLYVLIFFVLAVSLFQTVLQHLRLHALAYTAGGLDVNLGRRVFEHLLRLPTEYFDRTASGQIVTRVREIDTIRRLLLDQGTATFCDFVFVALYLLILISYSARLSMLVFSSIAAHVISVSIIRPRMRSRSREAFSANAAKQDFLVDSLNGILTLKSAAAEPSVVLEWGNRLRAHARATFRLIALSGYGQPIAQHIGTLTTVSILFFGTRAAIEGEMTLGELLSFNMIAGLVQAPIFRLVPLWQNFQELLVSLERLGDIMSIPEEDSKPHTRLSIVHGALSLRDVVFRYSPGSPLVLRDITLEIPRGQIVGIVGPSGSGKSTLVKLIQRLYVSGSGTLTLDGTDIATIDPRCVREHVAIVLQESALFRGTIHENIALSNPGLSREEVRRAAMLAAADDFIMRMPHGYDTHLESRGSNLSHGQRQRLAIARALAHNPRILILDEATSAVDYDTELAVQRNLPQISKGRTIIIVSHRLPILQHCDRIVVMRSGEIVEDDTHAALLRRESGLYRHLWDLHVREGALGREAEFRTAIES